MKHPTGEEWMWYLYGELDGKRQSALTRHLRECSTCQSEVNRWHATKEDLNQWKLAPALQPSIPLGRLAGRLTRWAVAAVLLIAAGYALTPSTQTPIDTAIWRAQLEASLKASLEPQIRQNLREEMDHNWQTLAEATVKTNLLLTELIESISTVRAQERRWVAAMLDDIEWERLQANNVLKYDLAYLAVETEQKLAQNKQDMLELVAYGRSEEILPDRLETATPPNERTPQ